MTYSSTPIPVYLEIGKKRTFAGAVQWPGWCRSGRDESAALQALFEYGPRYGRVVSGAKLGFRAPLTLPTLVVRERLAGNAITDFGAPGLAPAADARAVDASEVRRLQALLRACWRAFDAATKAARGKELRKGPRGGGRDTEKIIRHVLGAEAAYLGQLGWAFKADEAADLTPELMRTRQAALLAAQRIDPQVTEAQITPTEVALTLTYRLGGPRARFTPLVVRADLHSVLATLPRPVAP